MDFTLSPLIITAIIGNIGIVQAIKIKFPTLSSFMVSAISSIIGAFGVATMSGLPVLVAIQSLLLNWSIVFGGSCLMFESVIKRFTKEPSNVQTPEKPI